jgi:hypothetical protein
MRTLVFVLLALMSCSLAAPLTQGNMLVVRNGKDSILNDLISDFNFKEMLGFGMLGTPSMNFCTSNGSVWETTFGGQEVQQLSIPSECQFFYTDFYSGYITLATDQLSAVLPCCVDQEITPKTVGFVQIFGNGTVSAMKTLQLPEKDINTVHNIILDGSDLWFVGRGSPNNSTLHYANLVNNQVVVLFEDDPFFVNIIDDELLVGNFEEMSDGLFRVGSGLPKEDTPALTPLLNASNALDWFENTDNYCYYAEYAPVGGLYRCDESWNVLYSIALDVEITKFVVQYNNASDIVIYGTIVGEMEMGIIVLRDDGTNITEVYRIASEPDMADKIGSLTPSINHCENAIKDADETDVDCGGSLCDTCQNGKACSMNDDCASGNCANDICAGKSHRPTRVPIADLIFVALVPVAPVAPVAPAAPAAPTGKTSDSSVKRLALGTAAVLLICSL